MLSIKNDYEYIELVKESKFISLIHKVYSKEDVNLYLKIVKEKYPNATHYCYGYVINNDIKSSDDGEPAKTAGYPILNQILANNLNYTLIIVVRYFGGIKLGTGPLTRTYSKLAKNAITPNNIIELVEGYNITITFSYNDIKKIDYLLKDSKIINKSFGDNIIYQVLVKKDLINVLTPFNTIINKEIYMEKE